MTLTEERVREMSLILDAMRSHLRDGDPIIVSVATGGDLAKALNEVLALRAQNAALRQMVDDLCGEFLNHPIAPTSGPALRGLASTYRSRLVDLGQL